MKIAKKSIFYFLNWIFSKSDSVLNNRNNIIFNPNLYEFLIYILSASSIEKH